MIGRYGRDAPAPDTPQRGWLVSFADLVSILLTFMVMLFTLSAHDRDPASGIGYDALLDRLGIIQPSAGWKASTRLAPAQETPPFEDELDYLSSVLVLTLRDHPALADIRIDRRDEQLEVQLAGEPLFLPGRAEFTRGAAERLAALARALADLRPQIAVVGAVGEGPLRPTAGNADDRASGRAPAQAAWELALERALSTRAALAAAGLDRTVTVSAGIPAGNAAAAAQVGIVLFEGGRGG